MSGDVALGRWWLTSSEHTKQYAAMLSVWNGRHTSAGKETPAIVCSEPRLLMLPKWSKISVMRYWYDRGPPVMLTLWPTLGSSNVTRRSRPVFNSVPLTSKQTQQINHLCALRRTSDTLVFAFFYLFPYLIITHATWVGNLSQGGFS